MCLMQETTLENKIHYYSHIIIIKNGINYATLCLLATWLIQDLLNSAPLRGLKKISFLLYWLFKDG